MKALSRRSLLVYAFYLALALLITFPLVLNFSSQIIGHPTGDVYEMAHHIWWFKYALQNGEPVFYQTLSGYPEGFTAVSLWANPLQFFPMWAFAFVMPVAAAYNLTVLLTLALNGWAMCWVMWRWTGEAGNALNLPALLAGVVYMAYSTMQGHLFAGHAGLLVAWGAPLYVYWLFKLCETPKPISRRSFALAVVFFLIVPSGHTLQLIYVLMPITGLFILSKIMQGQWRGAGLAVLVSIVGSLSLLMFVLPVFSDTFGSETYTGDTGYIRYSIDLLGIVTPSFGHPVFGAWETTGRVLGVNLPEGYTYYGIAAGLLTLVAVWSHKTARWWFVLAILAWVLALGPLLKLYDTPITLILDGYPTAITPPWAFIYTLPGFSLARTPGRFTFVLALAAAVLVGYGAQLLWQRYERGLRVTFALVMSGAFAVWEYQAFFPHYTVPADVPTAIQRLAEDDDLRAVMDMPWGNLLAAKQGMYLQTWHQKPLIAGHVTRRTPVNPAKLTLLETSLDLALLDAEGVDAIILHKAYDDGTLNRRLRDSLGQPTFEDERFALFAVPKPPANTRVSFVSTFTTAESSLPVADRHESYIFTPSPGWMDFSGTLDADGRDATLYLNGRAIHYWREIRTKTLFTVPLPLDFRGYHTVTLALEPACPLFYDATLKCRTLRVGELSSRWLSSEPLYAPIELGNGVTLASAYLPPAPIRAEVLPVRLWWTFSQDRSASDIRFIKVISANGTQAAALDSAPGSLSAGGELAERLDLDISGLAGRYEVYVGWYRLPEVIRFPVLSEVKGAQDGLIYIGTIQVE